MMENVKRAFKPFLCAVMIALAGSAYAFTAIAVIAGNSPRSIYRANNYDVQKEADNAALQGCRATAKTNGIGKLAKQCKIVSRAPNPGYGTIVCGVDGCSWGMAFGSAQEAIDAIYADCAKSYTNCRDKDINFWEDRAGFPTGTTVSAPISGDCRPRTNTLQCSSSCNNGSCLVKYENGCQIRVQVQPRFNSFNNQWEYPAPSC
jgi:hypothetical protein